MKFKKNDTIVATNLSTKEQTVFKCPADGMCDKMLKRYVVKLGLPVSDYLFVKQ